MKQNKRKHLQTLFETLGEKHQFNGTVLAAWLSVSGRNDSAFIEPYVRAS